MIVKIICPFCGLEATLGENELLHELPACQAYLDLSSEDYVHECYEIISNTVKPETRSN
jgi:hypothetical protein